MLLTKAKFALNVIDVSTKHIQRQVSLRKKLETSENDLNVLNSYITTQTSAPTYSTVAINHVCKDVLKDIRDSKINKILTNL